MGRTESESSRNEVALVFPYEEGIAEGTEHEADEDLPWVGIGLGKVHAMEQDEEHEGNHGQQLEDAVDDAVQTRFIPIENEEDGHRLEERHQLGANALQLQQENRVTWINTIMYSSL